MNLQEYIASKKVKKVPADIQERWQTRIVTRGLHQMGEEGAQSYLRDYGKGIAAPKVLALAQQAANMGCTAMAVGFYKKAAELEGVTLTGRFDAAEVSGVGNIATAINAAKSVYDAPQPLIEAFPRDLQPGQYAPMQPVDAQRDQMFYVKSDHYWGQPKIDGNKVIIFASPTGVFYQSRQMKLNGTPNAFLDMRLRDVAQLIGAFIIEGELTYLDCDGKEHRTGSQAATYNSDHGFPLVQPDQIYYVFSCLWHAGCDLRHQSDRVDDGYRIANLLAKETTCVSPITTARTIQEKALLTSEQKAYGREGEIWFISDMPLCPGKNKNDSYVRTKYLTEFVALVTGFTETTAEGHAFGAMTITDLDGKPLGNVGTGFTREDKRLLVKWFNSKGPFAVQIRSQGYTEAGLAWHARFLQIEL